MVKGEVLDAGTDLVIAAFAAAVHGHLEHEHRSFVPAVADTLLAHDQ